MIRHGNKIVDTIWVHCAATRPEWLAGRPLAEKVAEITRWHVQERKWRTIGYHYVIDRDGSIAQCLIGGFGSNENDAFERHFTPEQDRALRGLIEEISSRAAIKRVRGHNEAAAKACPGFQVSRWLAHKPAKPTLRESTTVQASAVQIASGGGAAVAAVSALDGTAQIVALVFAGIVVLAGLWIMRERIRKWAREVHE
jgi:hypothetical protein